MPLIPALRRQMQQISVPGQPGLHRETLSQSKKKEIVPGARNLVILPQVSQVIDLVGEPTTATLLNQYNP